MWITRRVLLYGSCLLANIGQFRKVLPRYCQTAKQRDRFWNRTAVPLRNGVPPVVSCSLEDDTSEQLVVIASWRRSPASPLERGFYTSISPLVEHVFEFSGISIRNERSPTLLNYALQLVMKQYYLYILI